MAAPYVYEPACSPHLAGRMAGRYADVSTITGCISELLHHRQAAVVEGAGGVAVPLNENETMLDLMKALRYPVVLVSRVGLGAINHALLSIHALRSEDIGLLGVVFNQTGPPELPDQFIEEDNPRAIARFGDVRVLGNVGYLGPETQSDETWRIFEQSVPGLPQIMAAVRS
jgi:dethiobiotin synthetase